MKHKIFIEVTAETLADARTALTKAITDLSAKSILPTTPNPYSNNGAKRYPGDTGTGRDARHLWRWQVHYQKSGKENGTQTSLLNE